MNDQCEQRMICARDHLVSEIDDKIRELQRVMDKLTRMKGPRK